jgi:chaperonin GroES
MNWLTSILAIDYIITSPNLLPRLTEAERRALGHQVCEDFKRDQDSRREWERRMQKAMDMALQIVEKKTFPWENAANVKLPLITVAAIQYQSRIYPAMLNGSQPVKAKPISLDKEAKDRAKRIGAHMSYQLLEGMVDWEEEQDKAYMIQAIMGCVFKKTWHDPARGVNRSIAVNPRDLYINYWATSIEEAPRATHLLYLSHNTCRENQILGVFDEFLTEYHEQPKHRDGNGVDNRQGTNPPPVDHSTPYECYEQTLYLDLDDDGYAEPYVCTVRADTRQPLRLAPLFTRKDITYERVPTGIKRPARILRIEPCSMYTCYPFIPSPDGGVYHLGLGSLLGPLSHIVDSAINQMLDAGTLANAGGGFLGKNAKLKKGDIHISPGKWVQLDCPGAQMKDAIMPAPVPQPSEALFKLVTLLIEWGQNIVGATDAMLGGNPGQNTPAMTQQSMIEQGMATFNGIYKRTYKSFTREMQKLYRLNTNFLTEGKTTFYTMKDQSVDIFAADYSSEGAQWIRPGANPRYMSDQQRLMQAANIFNASGSRPGWDRYQADLNMLEAWHVEEPERFVVDPELLLAAQQDPEKMKQIPAGARPSPNPVMIQAQAKQAVAQAKTDEVKLKQAEMQKKFEQEAQQFQLEVEKTRAEIAELSARAASEMAQANGVQTGHQIALLEAEIGAKNAHLDRVLKIADMHQKVVGQTLDLANASADRSHERSMADMEAARRNAAGNQGPTAST